MKQNSQYIMCNETLLPIFLPLSLTSWWFFTNPFEKKICSSNWIISPKIPLKDSNKIFGSPPPAISSYTSSPFPPIKNRRNPPPRQIDFASQKCFLAASAERFHLQQQSDPACLGDEGKKSSPPIRNSLLSPLGAMKFKSFKLYSWLVVEPTHLKKYESTWVHLPQFSG